MNEDKIWVISTEGFPEFDKNTMTVGILALVPVSVY